MTIPIIIFLHIVVTFVGVMPRWSVVLTWWLQANVTAMEEASEMMEREKVGQV